VVAGLDGNVPRQHSRPRASSTPLVPEPVAPSERDSSLATVSEITGMVSTIFLSSSGGADDDMVLPQALPVSDIASQSLERDYQVA